MNNIEAGRIYNLVYNKVGEMIKENTTDEVEIWLLNCDFRTNGGTEVYGPSDEVMTICLNLSTRIIRCNIKNNVCIINDPLDLCDAIAFMYLSYISNLDINELKDSVNKYNKFKSYYVIYKYNTFYDNNRHITYIDEEQNEIEKIA